MPELAPFEVAANPDPDSTTAFLIRLPLTNGELVLKARDSRSRTAKVYCHRATQPGFVTEILAALTVRYPTVPITLAETDAGRHRCGEGIEFVDPGTQAGRESVR